MNKVKVGVFPCGSEVGLEINRALKYYRHFHLIGLNSVDDHGRILYEDYIGNLPLLREDIFCEEIKNIVKETGIDFLIPAMDEAGYLLKQLEADLSCEVAYPDLTTAEIIRRKSTTYEKLKGVVHTPKVFQEKKKLFDQLPFFVKPDIGYGSRGTNKIETEDEIELIYDELGDIVAMEYLPGEEYTIDCFSTGDGELLFSGARRRNRVRMGISVATETVRDQDIFRDIARKIGRVLEMKGLWFFQLKRDKDEQLTLLEVAGRVSGSMALYRALGINFVALDLFQRLGNEITVPKLYADEAILERALDCTVELPLDFDTVYCDLDDCLILQEEVNTNLIRFLYQCVNAKKKLILLTRHNGNPDETLQDYRLTSLFDEVIHIEDESRSKAEAIQNKSSIFIDDSFAERQSVASIHNIPVFAPDAIDLLISKK